MNKIILTDVDGVLTDWVIGFREWMADLGWEENPDFADHYTIDKWYNITYDDAMKLVCQYNASAAMGFLPPYLDSVHYVKLLHEKHGYRFHAISSLGRNKYAMLLREQNLRNLFGENTFAKFEFLDANENKRQVLEKYTDSHYWIEDKPENAIDGHALGLRSILMKHGHNCNHSIPDNIPHVETWKHIYEIILDG